MTSFNNDAHKAALSALFDDDDETTVEPIADEQTEVEQPEVEDHVAARFRDFEIEDSDEQPEVEQEIQRFRVVEVEDDDEQEIEREPEIKQVGIAIDRYGHSIRRVTSGVINTLAAAIVAFPEVFTKIHAEPCMRGDVIPVDPKHKLPLQRWIVRDDTDQVYGPVGQKFGASKLRHEPDGKKKKATTEYDLDEYKLPVPIQTVDFFRYMEPLIEHFGVRNGLNMHNGATVGLQLDGGTIRSPNSDVHFNPLILRSIDGRLSPVVSMDGGVVEVCENQLVGALGRAKLQIKIKQTRKFFQRAAAVGELINAISDSKSGLQARFLNMGRKQITSKEAREILIARNYLTLGDEGQLDDASQKRWDDVRALACGDPAPSNGLVVDGAHMKNGSVTAWGWNQGVTAYETHMRRIRSMDSYLVGSTHQRLGNVFQGLALAAESN